MRGLLQHWTESSIFLTSKEESVWRNKRPRNRTVSFEEDRLLTWSTITSGSLEPMILSRTMPTYSLLVFEMTIFRNSIQSAKIHTNDILEGLYKLRIRESEKLKTVLELYDLEIHQKKIGPDAHRQETMVKRSIEQDVRNRNLAPEMEIMKETPWSRIRGQRGQRILGYCWQWEANGQCSEGDNCSFRRDINKRAKMTQPNPSPNSFMQQNERKASRTRSPRGKSPSGRMSRWPCKDYLRGTCTKSFCKKRHPPECLFYKTKSGCRFGEKCSYAYRHVDEQPSKRSKKNDDKSAVAMLMKGDWHERRFVTDQGHDRSPQPDKKSDKKFGRSDHLMHDSWVVSFKTWSRRSLYYARPQTCRNQSNVWDSRKLLHVTLKFETKILRSDIFAQVNLISAAPTLQNLRIGLRRRQSGKSKGAREAAWKLAKSVLNLKEKSKATL